MIPATLAARSQALAAELSRALPCQDRVDGGPTCLEREEARPLAVGEAVLGWTKRPWDAYNAHALCAACAAVWHAELCARMVAQVARPCVVAGKGACAGRRPSGRRKG